jgi:hypothetical protein
MLALAARLFSPQVRQLAEGLAAERKMRGEVSAQLAECRRLVDEISLMAGDLSVDDPLAAALDECKRLRRLCSAQADQLARFEGRPLQVDLPPIRTAVTVAEAAKMRDAHVSRAADPCECSSCGYANVDPVTLP